MQAAWREWRFSSAEDLQPSIDEFGLAGWTDVLHRCAPSGLLAEAVDVVVESEGGASEARMAMNT